MTLCLLFVVVATLMFAVPAPDGIRDRFLRALVLFGAALFIVTELLSAFRLIRYAPLVVCWSTITLLGLICIAMKRRTLRFATRPFR